MITYKPFADYLKKFGYTLEDVSRRTKIPLGILRAKMNNTEYVPMEYIDLICQMFDLKVEQVIAYSKGKQHGSEKLVPDWEKIGGLLAEQGVSIHKLSERCMLSDNTLYLDRKRGSKVHVSVMKNVAKELGVEMEEIVASKEEEDGQDSDSQDKE